jgi:DNA-binding transcriptional ArsR family regulator
MEFPEIRLNSEQLRVLAHPLRSRLLTALRLDGPATATRLAASLGTNTGATSYHLRQLAAVGLVVEEERTGAGRQRWWRAAQASHGWLDKDVADDPDDRAAADWLSGHYLRWFTDMAQRWLAERHEWPAPWRESGFSSDFLLELTPQRLRELKEELKEVVLRYREEPAPEGSEQVILAVYGFPLKRGER